MFRYIVVMELIMTKIKKVTNCKTDFLFKIICFSIIILILGVSFIGCSDINEDDRSIGRITITGIPAKIPINRNLQEPARDTFTLYFNASNYQTSREGLPEAKGLVRVNDEDKFILQQDGTYTVIVDLELPNPENNMDPTLYHGPWSGTAKLFSVYITPQDTLPFQVDAMWAKGGYTLNKSKSTIDWKDLVNLRNPVLNMVEQNTTLYTEIIHNDPKVNTSLEGLQTEW